jgi:hypothetical protein
VNLATSRGDRGVREPDWSSLPDGQANGHHLIQTICVSGGSGGTAAYGPDRLIVRFAVTGATTEDLRRLRLRQNHCIPAVPAHHVGMDDDGVTTMPGLYAVRIRGRLGATALSAFPSMVSQLKDSETMLTGLLADRSAVFGVIWQIEGLGLELLELRHIQAGLKQPEEADPGVRDDLS